MNIWSVLGIEETRDKDKLKAAYREKLLGVNPEDDAEGFMRLRRAYEEAVKLADRSNYNDISFDDDEDADSEDNETETKFTFKYNEKYNALLEEIDEIYNDYEKRIDEENWDRILNKDEFISLDTSEEATDVLIKYLMENFLLPHVIWKKIVYTLGIKERKRELYQKYPRDFIDFMLDNSENMDVINYYLFDNDIDNDNIDDFIKIYLSANSSIRRGQVDEAKSLLRESERFGYYHPYIELARIRIKINELEDREDKEKLSKYMDELEALYNDFPEDFNIVVACGDVAIILKDTKKAEKYYEIAKKLEPESYIVKIKLAELSYYKEDYEASRDAFMELLRSNNYENAIRAGMLRANLALIEKYKERILINPDDNDTKIEMAWSYYQSYKFREAIEILDDFEPIGEKVFEYFNVKGRSYLCLLEYDKALSCFYRWKEAITALPKNDDEEIIKKKKRLPYVNFLIADCYLKLKKYEQAENFLNIALEVPHDEIILSYEALCELKYETKRYDECLNACEKLLELGDNNYIAYDYMAKSYFEIRYMKDAIDACESAINIYPYAADPYALEVEIFLLIGHMDTAKRVVEKYRSLGVPSDRITYCEALILKKEEKYAEAVEKLREIERININESDLTSMADVYHDMAECYDRINRLDMALDYYMKVRRIEPEYDFICAEIAVILKKLGDFKKAREYWLMEANKENTDVHLRKPDLYAYYIYEGGNIYRALGNLRTALARYENALQINIKYAECYRDAALLYEHMGNFDKAFMYYKKAIEYTQSEEAKPFLYICEARVLQCMKQYEMARQVYIDYSESFEINCDFIYDYSIMLQRMNDIEGAVKLIKDNLNSFKDDDRELILLRRLCTIYAEEGYLNNANELFGVIINKYPNDYKTYKIMADALKNQGLYSEATEYYNKAIALDIAKKENYYSDLAENEIQKKGLFKKDLSSIISMAVKKGERRQTIIDYINAAKINRVTKKYKIALQIINDGLKRTRRCFGCFYNSCHEAYYEMGKIYEAMKNYDKAAECYRQALSIKGHCVLYEDSLKRINGK